MLPPCSGTMAHRLEVALRLEEVEFLVVACWDWCLLCLLDWA